MYLIKDRDNLVFAFIDNKLTVIFYIPNILTLARIAMVPLLLVLLKEQNFQFALIVFLLAGITDAADGYIAKKFNAVTRLGSILDPLADKALLVSAYIMLSMLQLIPYWLMVVVVFRDVVIIVGYLVMTLFFEPVEMQPLKISKLNTFIQIAFIVVALISFSSWMDFSAYLSFAGYCVLLTSVLSGCTYVYIWSIKAIQSE